MNFNLNTIDLLISIVYIVFVILLGFHFGKKHENAKDYFVAGRSVTWLLVVLNMIFPAFRLNFIIIFLVVIAGTYTISGGLATRGWQAEITNTDHFHFNIIKPLENEALPYPVIFTEVMIVGFFFWGTNQYSMLKQKACQICHGIRITDIKDLRLRFL